MGWKESILSRIRFSEAPFLDPNVGGIGEEVSMEGFDGGGGGVREDVVFGLEEGSGRPLVVIAWLLTMGGKGGEDTSYTDWGGGTRRRGHWGMQRGGSF